MSWNLHLGLTSTLTLTQKDCSTCTDNHILEIPKEINTSANQVSARAALDLDISAPQISAPPPHPSASQMHGLLPLPCLPPSSYLDNVLLAGSRMTTHSAEAQFRTPSDQTPNQLWSKTSGSGHLGLTSTFEAPFLNCKDPNGQEETRQASNHDMPSSSSSSKVQVHVQF
jgi:hypothetical protein